MFTFTALEKVGLVCISVVTIQFARTILRLLYNTVIGPAIKRVNLKEKGQWAVVTGATDGIGKAFVEALAAQGMDIVLISRSQTKLETVAAEIESVYKVRTKVIVADFTDDSKEAYLEIEKHFYILNVGVLVNNVGISYPYPEYLTDLPDSDKVYNDIVKCNMVSLINMTRMILRNMRERHSGVIINISSTAALIPSPMLTVYGASKAFVEKFSRDLAAEVSQKNIIVQCYTPGYVATKMSKIRQSSWMAPSPDRFVAHALSSLGVQDVTTGYFPHTMLVSVVKLMQSVSPTFTTWVIKRTMQNIRGRALARQGATPPATE